MWREGCGRGGETQDESLRLDRWRCTPAGLVASLYRSVDLCEPKARVRERCLGRTYCAGGAWRPSVSRVRHASGCGDGPVARSVSGVSVSETVPLVPVRAASGEPGCVCVFSDLLPYSYRIHHTRGASARQLTTSQAYHSRFTFLKLHGGVPPGPADRGRCGVRTCAASSCCTRSLSARSTPPSSFGSSCVASCAATGGNGTVSK